MSFTRRRWFKGAAAAAAAALTSPGGALRVMLPFHLDTRSSSARKNPSTSHAWAVQHEAWNGGKMGQWLPAHRKADGVKVPYLIGYYPRADIPFQFALAESFTICDSYYCSVFGPRGRTGCIR
jgi:phospholipase C